ncbi:BatD family protein [Flavobacterium sp. UBA6135]|uniref:BatD family protein n=1 Tax=Flavobacterium sp. UBA6135 TaxID=1946553 RepID=UPI0025C15305|nr:BatD family protein [Flavobacterium sp. UBA6135]
MKKYIFILFLSMQSLMAQVQFEAKVSKTTLGLNERLRIDFVMNVDGDNFNPPSFDGFRVVGGPSQQVSQSWVNGKSSFNKVYTYFLLPTQRGAVTIRQASIEYQGQTYKTTPLSVNVTAAVEQPKDPNDTSISINDALHLVAEVNKTNPYLNEPITVVYKLYFSYNIGITNWRELDKPKYNDFWSQNIDIKQLSAEEGTYNGEKFRYVVLRKTVLYPQKSGKLEIEPLSLDIDVELPTNRRDIFGRVLMTRDNKRVSAGSKVITVKPLPENGKPDDFTGAVGKFDFQVVPSRTTLKHGESTDLDITVTGTGNLKLFNLPKPVVPSSLEMYEPVHSENVSTPLSGMTGKISDKYTIIPQYKGNYTIKPIRFSYFDYAAGAYKTLTSQEIVISVLDGPSAGDKQDIVQENAVVKNQISNSDQFKYIHLKTKLSPINKKAFFGSTLFYVLLGLPFLLIPLIILFKKKKEAIDGDVVGNKLKLNTKLAKKFLSEAKKQIGTKEPFYVALERSLHNFLKAKLKIETSEMSKDKIRATLTEKKAQPETIDLFIQLTENCEFARYAPSTTVAMQQDYDKAVEVISELEKQIV